MTTGENGNILLLLRWEEFFVEMKNARVRCVIPFLFLRRRRSWSGRSRSIIIFYKSLKNRRATIFKMVNKKKLPSEESESDRIFVINLIKLQTIAVLNSILEALPQLFRRKLVSSWIISLSFYQLKMRLEYINTPLILSSGELQRRTVLKSGLEGSKSSRRKSSIL